MTPELWGTIGVIVTALISGLGGIIVARTSARSNEHVSDSEQRSEEWQAITKALRVDVDNLRARLDSRDRDVKDLQRRVGTLQDSLDTISKKLRRALAHIREWRAGHPDELESYPLPEDLWEDITD